MSKKPVQGARKPPVHTVAHHAHHARPAPARRPAAGGGAGPKGGSAKHQHARHHRRKHQKRGLALGEMVACCAAEALAMSLRLAGHPVSDTDVLDLYWRTAAGPDDGATIEATLDAAAEFGLAGHLVEGAAESPAHVLVPQVVPEEDEALDGLRVELDGGMDRAVHGLILDAARFGVAGAHPQEAGRAVRSGTAPGSLTLTCRRCADQPLLILGVDLPGAHTVLATADGWWSWGELHSPDEWPDAVIEEAWAVTW